MSIIPAARLPQVQPSDSVASMGWKRRANQVLGRTMGLELRRVDTGSTRKRRPAPGRLVSAPVFIFCSVRSGSTLLRVLMGSHSQIHAPHELHLKDLKVSHTLKNAERSSRALGLDEEELEYLLWDRLLHRELTKSGKRFIVEKTPGDVLIWRRIAKCWPDARFIFLLRHPVSIISSWQEVYPERTAEQTINSVLKFMNAIEEARAELPGLTLRYEELTTKPEEVTRRLCEFLGVAWEPGMLEYGKGDHGRFAPGLGDWGEKIRSGKIQAAAPPPGADEIPEALMGICSSWGYLHDVSQAHVRS